MDPQSLGRDTRRFSRQLLKVLGISNALDGTEDEAVWEEEGAGADEADDELENEFDTDSEQED